MHYRDIGDYLTREDKLRTVADGKLTRRSIGMRIDAQRVTATGSVSASEEFLTWPGDRRQDRLEPSVFATLLMRG
ncbi:MAG: hypothetical protein WKF73_09675 [Nocardioidaceae bacterium]